MLLIVLALSLALICKARTFFELFNHLSRSPGSIPIDSTTSAFLKFLFTKPLPEMARLLASCMGFLVNFSLIKARIVKIITSDEYEGLAGRDPPKDEEAARECRLRGTFGRPGAHERGTWGHAMTRAGMTA